MQSSFLKEHWQIRVRFGKMLFTKNKKTYFVRDNVAKIACQVIGGLLSLPFTQVLWQAKWSDFHEKQVERGLQSTLEVSLMYGFFVEIIGTFITTMCDFMSRSPALKKFRAVIRGNRGTRNRPVRFSGLSRNSSQMYKLVRAIEIPSVGEQKYSQLLRAKETIWALVTCASLHLTEHANFQFKE